MKQVGSILLLVTLLGVVFSLYLFSGSSDQKNYDVTDTTVVKTIDGEEPSQDHDDSPDTSIVTDKDDEEQVQDHSNALNADITDNTSQSVSDPEGPSVVEILTKLVYDYYETSLSGNEIAEDKLFLESRFFQGEDIYQRNLESQKFMEQVVLSYQILDISIIQDLQNLTATVDVVYSVDTNDEVDQRVFTPGKDVYYQTIFVKKIDDDWRITDVIEAESETQRIVASFNEAQAPAHQLEAYLYDMDPHIYGGMFINDDNGLSIWAKDKEKIEDVISKYSGPDVTVIYLETSYSLSDLETKVTQLKDTLGFISNFDAYVGLQSNKIIVNLNNENERKAVEDHISKLPDKQIYEILLNAITDT